MADAFTNFAKSTLAGGLAPATTALTVQVGDGALFPAAGAGQTFRFVLQNTANQREVCVCTLRTGDVFNTILRNQEGTTALTWNAGDRVGHRLTAAQLNNILVSSDLQQNTKTWCGTAGGTANALTLTPTPAVTAMVAGHKFIFKTGVAANATPVTIAVSGLAPFAAQNSGVALGAGDLAANSWYEVLYDGAAGQLKKYTVGIPLNTKGDLWGFSTTDARVAVGGDNTVLGPDSTVATGLAYVTLGAGSVRQSVLAATLDSNGYNNAITTGAGLRPGLSATTTACVLAFAAGFGTRGSSDLVSRLTADVADILGANLPLSNTSFLHATYTSSSAVVWSSCLVPPQYAYAFDRSKGALLNMEGVNNGTSFIDDFGNTYARNTNVVTDTSQFKFGTSSAKSPGGATDYIESTNYTSLGEGSWQIECWFRINALPGAATQAAFFGAGNGSNFGALLRLNNNAGTVKLEFLGSSDGTTFNLAPPLGTNTTWTLNQWNKVRLVFDALAGSSKVFLSLNGAADTTDITLASSAKICAITRMRIFNEGGATSFNGWIDAFRFLPCVTNTSAETPSVSAPVIGDYPVHFFSVPEMKMYEATAASAVAGTNPTLTQRNRLFVAEADTSGAAVTAVRNYAIRGKYRSALTAVPGVGVRTSFSHNIGTRLGVTARARGVVTTSGSTLVVGEEFDLAAYSSVGPYMVPPIDSSTRNTLNVQCGTNGFLLTNSAGVALAYGVGSGGSAETNVTKFYAEVERTW